MSKRTSECYQFTVHGEDYQAVMKIVQPLKDNVRIANAYRRAEELDGTRRVTEWKHWDGTTSKLVQRLRVVVRGRLGKDNPHRHLYAVGGPLKRHSAQTIRPEHATRFDVYVQDATVSRK